jgi:ligand-binding sensor domain-containing protein
MDWNKTSGIYKYETSTKNLLHCKWDANGIDVDVRAIDIDFKGALWIGTYNELV